MASQQYDISPQDRRLFEEKQKQRLALREYFIKHISNPHRHATGEGGYLFDSGVQRYMAMRFKQYEYFRPSPVSAAYGLGIFVIPSLLYGYLMYKERETKEHKYRTGQVSYHDRPFKFL